MNEYVDFPVPISDGRWAFVKFPTDLTRKDVQRVIAILNTLMPDEEKVERATRPVMESDDDH